MTKYNIFDRFTLRDPNSKVEQEVFITMITLDPTPITRDDKIIYTFSNQQHCNEVTITEQIENGLILPKPSN